MKIKNVSILTALALVAGALTSSAQTPPTPTVATNVIAESTVQYTALTTTRSSFTNYASGYDKIKYSLTAPAKTYLKFDFTGQKPNTNYLLRLSMPTISNNGKTHFMVWALNQAYAGLTTNGQTVFNNVAVTPTLTWSNAQANFTGTNEPTYNAMLTSGPLTATLLTDFVGNSGAGGVGVSIPAPWGNYLIGNQISIVLTATNDAANTDGTTGNGGRLTLNSATATFQPLTTGNPPTITAISAQTVKSTTASGAIAFTVGDVEDAASSLTNFSITLGNTNVTLTTTNITIGAGGSRTLSFTPLSNLAAGQTASVTVTVIITDSNGNSASSAFLLTVPPLISLPIVLSGTNVNYIPPTNRIGIGSLIISFQVVDTNVPASSLVVTGSVSAYSTNLGSISFTSTTGIAPNTNNCTLTINATGSGVGIVNVSVIDPTNLVTNNVPVAIMILPDGSYAAYDAMNYRPSTSASTSGHADLLDVSANLWAPRSVAGSVNLITTLTPSSGGVIPVGIPVIRGSGSGNPNELRLVGSPFTPSSHKVLFASVNAQWADIQPYGFNAVYPGNSTGGFLLFAADGAATSVAMAAVCTLTNVANTSTTDGSFDLGLYNGTNSAVVNTGASQTIPNFLSSGVLPNAPVNIVISYDVDSGVSRLWLNQSSSTGTSVSLQDVAVTNLANVNYIVLRQNAGMGNILIESVAVKVVTKPVPSITGITRSGNNVVISFTSAPGSGGSASAVGTSNLNNAFTTVGSVTINESPASSGNFTASFTATGSQMFYRIAQTGGTPVVNFPF